MITQPVEHPALHKQIQEVNEMLTSVMAKLTLIGNPNVSMAIQDIRQVSESLNSLESGVNNQLLVNPPGTRRIDVTCDHATVGLQAVRRLPGVRTATVFGQSMHLLVEEGMSEQAIREELARHNIPQADIRPIAPSLEDVFVALTNNQNGEKQ